MLDADGRVVREERRLSPHAGVDSLVATAAAIVEELAAPGIPVGVGAAGLVNHDGHVLYSPNLPTVVDAPLREALFAATNHPLVVDNDANVAARGEVAYGAAKSVQHALLVTLGTGIGGGMLLNGELYRGAHGFGAEIGHITVERGGPLCACGEYGHWEAIASGTALGRIARRARCIRWRRGDPRGGRRDGRRNRRSPRRGSRARAGDADAVELLGVYADNVALGLASLANVLDPELIVIAGGLVELGPLLFDPLQASFMQHIEGAAYRPNIPIVPAELGERAGAVGAAVLARSTPAVSVRVGLTLPSFVEDPEIPITVARAAEEAGLDAVFVFDHLWRGDPPESAPRVGVLRAARRDRGGDHADPGRDAGRARRRCARPATLANCFLAAQRVSDGRLIAGIGAGDSREPRRERGVRLEFGTMVDRIGSLHDAVRAAEHARLSGLGRRARRAGARDRDAGRRLEPLGRHARTVLARGRCSCARSHPTATITWGGLVLTGDDEAAAQAKADDELGRR